MINRDAQHGYTRSDIIFTPRKDKNLLLLPLKRSPRDCDGYLRKSITALGSSHPGHTRYNEITTVILCGGSGDCTCTACTACVLYDFGQNNVMSIM